MDSEQSSLATFKDLSMQQVINENCSYYELHFLLEQVSNIISHLLQLLNLQFVKAH